MILFRILLCVYTKTSAGHSHDVKASLFALVCICVVRLRVIQTDLVADSVSLPVLMNLMTAKRSGETGDRFFALGSDRQVMKYQPMWEIEWWPILREKVTALMFT